MTVPEGKDEKDEGVCGSGRRHFYIGWLTDDLSDWLPFFLVFRHVVTGLLNSMELSNSVT